MHDLLVVLFTLAGLMAVLMATSALCDISDQRASERRIAILNHFIEECCDPGETNVILLIAAQLNQRMSMTDEFYITEAHRQLLQRIAYMLFVLTKANVRNQVDVLMVIADQLNRSDMFIARANFTTNNRVELVIQIRDTDQLVYIRFHSVNVLF